MTTTGVPTAPNSGTGEVAKCQANAEAELTKCEAAAQNIADDGIQYDQLAAIQGSLVPWGGGTSASQGSGIGNLGYSATAGSVATAYIGGGLGTVVGAANTNYGSTTGNKGVTKAAASSLICKSTRSTMNTACVAADGQPVLADALAKELGTLAQTAATSPQIQGALNQLKQCLPSLQQNQEQLKSRLATFLGEMPGALGGVVPNAYPASQGSYSNPSQGDVAKMMESWTSGPAVPLLMNGSLPNSLAKTIQSLPDSFDSTSNTVTIGGSTVLYSEWPVNYGVPLMALAILATKLTSGDVAPITKNDALTVASDPSNTAALDRVRKAVAQTETTFSAAQGGTGAAAANVKGDKDVLLVKTNSGGTLTAITNYGNGMLDGTQQVGHYTPTALAGIVSTAARLLKASNVPGAKEKGDWLAGQMAVLSPLLQGLETDTECVFNALQDLQEEEEKIEDALADIAERLKVDLSQGAGASAKKNLIAGLRSSGILGDYFNKSKVIFKEQCWLLGYVDSITEYKKLILDNPIPTTPNGTDFKPETAHKKLPYLPPTDPYSNDSIKKSGKSNACLLVDGDPYGFLNQLVVNPSTSTFMDATVAEMSSLQPSIKLYKVIYDEEGEDASEVMVPFKANNDPHGSGIEDYLKNGRGPGVGIKSFNFVYDGSNPFAIKKSISANLKIFANNMGELLKTRRIRSRAGPELIDNFRYTDLAMKTGKSIKSTRSVDLNKENTERSPLNFRLRATVGWAKPTSNAGGVISGGVMSALEDSHVTLNLTPTVHNFEIDEQGRVILNINYLAYIDEFFDQSAYDIFANARYVNPNADSKEMYVTTSRLMRKMRVETLNRTCDAADVTEQKEKDAETVKSESVSSLSFLISSLIHKDKIYYVNLPFEQVRAYNFYGPYSNYEAVSKLIFDPASQSSTVILQDSAQNDAIAQRVSEGMSELQKALDKAGTVNNADSIKENITAALVGANINGNTLSFFFLSDLVDSILDNIDKELDELPRELQELFIGAPGVTATFDPKKHFIEKDQILQTQIEYSRLRRNFENLRILLGPAELFTRKAEMIIGERLSVFVNLGDMPISVKYFMEFMTNKMLSNNKSSYPLTKFLNDLLNTLTRDFLNNGTCFGFPIKQKTRINQTVVTAYKPKYEQGERSDAAHEMIASADPLTLQLMAASQKSYPKAKFNAFIKRRAHRQELKHPILDVSGPSNSAITSVPINQECNYFVYFAARTQPTELMKGKRGEDESRGIFHYLLGRDKGLIKNIKLSKTQTKGLAEVRFESSGYQGLEQLRVIYDVEVDSYANVQTFPGSYIYVEPKGFLPQAVVDAEGKPIDITKMGIGGYYMIVRSEHEFGPGYGNSKITAKWVHSIEHAAEEQEVQSMAAEYGGSGAPRNPTCKYIRDREENAKL